MSILDKIVMTKQREIAAMQGAGQGHVFQESGFQFERPSFREAICQQGLSLIAEIKKASPSKGVIREQFSPVVLAKSLSQSASALSVLTDRDYFMGDPLYIPLIRQQVMIPVLRKEFIIDPIQVYQAKWLGASAILLIKAILDDNTACSLLDLATKIGLDVLFEVHAEDELRWALAQEKIQILGINSRDLRHFTIDQDALYRKLTLAKKTRPDMIVVAESGIQHTSDLDRLSEIGIDAVLIGEGLAKNPSLLERFTHV
jgi:indole-3-glycerol phosphate synthase